MQINVSNGERTFKLSKTEIKKLRDAMDIIANIGLVIDTEDCQKAMAKVIGDVGAAGAVLGAHAVTTDTEEEE